MIPRFTPSLFTVCLASTPSILIGQDARAAAIQTLNARGESLPPPSFGSITLPYNKIKALFQRPERAEVASEGVRLNVVQVFQETPDRVVPLESNWHAEGIVNIRSNAEVNKILIPDSNTTRDSIRPGLYQVFGLIERDTVPGEWSLHGQLAVQAGPALESLSPTSDAEGKSTRQVNAVFRHISGLNFGFNSPQGTRLACGIQYLPTGVDDHRTSHNLFSSFSINQETLPSYAQACSLYYPVNEQHAWQVWVVNGWRVVGDKNQMPSYILGHDYKNSKFELKTRFFLGPEKENIEFKAWRGFGEVMGEYQVVPQFTLGGVFDIGVERQLDQPREPLLKWMTLGITAKAEVLPWWTMGVRGEVHHDEGVLGSPQNLSEVSLVNAFLVNQNLRLRAECRLDRAMTSPPSSSDLILGCQLSVIANVMKKIPYRRHK